MVGTRVGDKVLTPHVVFCLLKRQLETSECVCVVMCGEGDINAADPLSRVVCRQEFEGIQVMVIDGRACVCAMVIWKTTLKQKPSMASSLMATTTGRTDW